MLRYLFARHPAILELGTGNGARVGWRVSLNSAKDLLQTRFKIGVALHAGLVSRAAGLLAFPDMSNKKWAYSNSEISHLHLRWVSPAAGWKTLVLGGALGLGGVCPRHGPRETPPGAGCGPEDPFLCYSTAPQDCTAGLHRRTAPQDCTARNT